MKVTFEMSAEFARLFCDCINVVASSTDEEEKLLQAKKFQVEKMVEELQKKMPCKHPLVHSVCELSLREGNAAIDHMSRQLKLMKETSAKFDSLISETKKQFIQENIEL